jgi:hypothetical protein
MSRKKFEGVLRNATYVAILMALYFISQGILYLHQGVVPTGLFLLFSGMANLYISNRNLKRLQKPNT